MIPAFSPKPSRLPGARRSPSASAWLPLLLALAFAGFSPNRAQSSQPTFRNDVMAVLSKAGCNAGACHGNANGKAGFKLSLRGEDLEFDFAALTREHFGRRINPLQPAKSLLLLKASAQVPHEGGKRFSPDSPEFAVLRDWIGAGAPPDPPGVPALAHLEVSPREQILIEPDMTVQLRVRASFSNGEQRDVASRAVYESSNPIVQITSNGGVTGLTSGETTILVRYLGLQQPVRLAFVPARPDFAWINPPAHNFVDEHIFQKLRRLRVNPSGLCTDTEFIRRAFQDLLGLIPSAQEAREFVFSQVPGKRALLVDSLLQRPEFADFWALKWADLLRGEERALDEKGLQNFQRWIRRGIEQGKPLDQFVRELLSARGSTYSNPAANFYRANRDPVSRAEAAAQVFFGARLQCAQCHNHPFDRWTQNDYYDWAALFAKIQYKVLENQRRDSNDSHEFKGEQIVYTSSQGEIKNPRTDKPALPRFLGAPENSPSLDAAEDPLDQLARWAASPENPFFARAQANRIWFHLMGRGLVDPIDDFRPTNPATHPELLEALAAEFAARQFDLRHLIRVIMASRAYQLSSLPNPSNLNDEINYSRALIRRLSAEQLLDCQSQALAVPLTFNGYPAGTRAAQLPGIASKRGRGQKMAALDQFLQLFGKPPRLLACECERSADITLGQTFQMISGPTVHDLLTAPNNRLAQLDQTGTSPSETIDQLYWTLLSRAPSAAEKETAAAHLQSSPSLRAGLEDLAWGLLNAKEFLLRH